MNDIAGRCRVAELEARLTELKSLNLSSKDGLEARNRAICVIVRKMTIAEREDADRKAEAEVELVRAICPDFDFNTPSA